MCDEHKECSKKNYLFTLSLSKQIPGRFFQLNHEGLRYLFHVICHCHLKFEALNSVLFTGSLNR
jgi:hypothetical protein